MSDTYDGFNPDDPLQANVDVSEATVEEAETHGIDMDDANDANDANDEIPEIPDDPEGELTDEDEEIENVNDAEPHQIGFKGNGMFSPFKPINESAAMMRQAEERHQNDIKALNGQGCFNLVGGIIRQNIDDYLKLEKAGVCKNGQVIVEKMPRKINEGMTIPEARQVCLFLQDDGPVLEWINLMGVNLSPVQLRRQAKLTW